MDPHHDRIRMMQAEMARFENEISGQFVMRPPMPRFGPNMMLRFLPHSLLRHPAAYAPPMMPQTTATGHMMPRHMPTAPRFCLKSSYPQPNKGSQPPGGEGTTSAVVIEGAPTKYTASSSKNQPPPPPVGLTPSIFQAFDIPKKSTPVQASVVPPLPPPSVLPSKASTISSNDNETTPLSKMANSISGGGGAAGSSSMNSSKSQAAAGGSSQPTSSSKAAAQAPRKYVRTAGGEVWEDQSLLEWDPNDYRIFCGDLGNEVSDELLAKAFRKYPSFQKAKVIREKRSNKTKGFGFVSFKDPQDFIRALREMDGKYVGNRPIKLRKSSWKDRNLRSVKKKEKEKKKLGLRV